MADQDDSAEARAHSLVTRILGFVQECRTSLRELATPATEQETPAAQAERHLHLALLGALADGLARTVDEALALLRHASRPLGPMGAEWLEEQERQLRLPGVGE